jgi:hypothetical protein
MLVYGKLEYTKENVILAWNNREKAGSSVDERWGSALSEREHGV